MIDTGEQWTSSAKFVSESELIVSSPKVHSSGNALVKVALNGLQFTHAPEFSAEELTENLAADESGKRKYYVGDRVEVREHDNTEAEDSAWHSGVIVEESFVASTGASMFSIQYDDGDEEDGVGSASMRLRQRGRVFKIKCAKKAKALEAVERQGGEVMESGRYLCYTYWKRPPELTLVRRGVQDLLAEMQQSERDWRQERNERFREDEFGAI
jgi:hypothetical protein